MAATGIDTFLHVGPGDVTAGLARRTVEGAQVLAVSGLEDVRSAVDAVVSIDRP
jgi:malonyl CoA-acyl carrier protein transacylase